MVRQNTDIIVPDYIYNAVRENSNVSFVGYKILNGMNPYPESIEDITNREKYLKLLSELINNISNVKIEYNAHSQYIEDFYESYKYYYEIYTSRVINKLNDNERRILEKLFYEYLNEDTNYTPTLIHGDLSSDHIFLDQEIDKINGVIDWGEASIGDPEFEYFAIYNDYGLDFVLELRNILKLDCNKRFINKLYLFSVCDIIEELDFDNEKLVISKLKEKIKGF